MSLVTRTPGSTGPRNDHKPSASFTITSTHGHRQYDDRHSQPTTLGHCHGWIGGLPDDRSGTGLNVEGARYRRPQMPISVVEPTVEVLISQPRGLAL
jgi:hypothetical protein